MVGNSYADRNQEVGAHSDNMALLGPLPIVAGLSFGSTRIFRLQEITGYRKGGTCLVLPLLALHLLTPHFLSHTHTPPSQTTTHTDDLALPGALEALGAQVHEQQPVLPHPLHFAGGAHLPHLPLQPPLRLSVPRNGIANSYQWVCDWARHTQRCNFRQDWVDPAVAAAASASAASAASAAAAAGQVGVEEKKEEKKAAPEVVVVEDD